MLEADLSGGPDTFKSRGRKESFSEDSRSPPPLHNFSIPWTNQQVKPLITLADQLFRILGQHYSPETRKAKTERLRQTAQTEAKSKKTKKEGDKPVSLKYGLNHVTYLIEQKRAKLVLIAADVEPIETVVFLPTLCKSMDIPYAIIPSKARLGELVHKKSATCVALTDFKEKQAELSNLARVCKDNFNNVDTKWKSKINN